MRLNWQFRCWDPANPLWFEPWYSNCCCGRSNVEQAFNAVNGFRELGACDMWTGNRSMLSVPAVSEIYFGTAQIAI